MGDEKRIKIHNSLSKNQVAVLKMNKINLKTKADLSPCNSVAWFCQLRSIYNAVIQTSSGIAMKAF